MAAQYAAARPGYPPALFDAIEELAGQPLTGARVLDVGAGSGIATGLLTGRGARVTSGPQYTCSGRPLPYSHSSNSSVRSTSVRAWQKAMNCFEPALE